MIVQGGCPRLRRNQEEPYRSFGIPDDGLHIRDQPVVVFRVVGETLLKPSPEVLPPTIVHRHQLALLGWVPSTGALFLSRFLCLPPAPLLTANAHTSQALLWPPGRRRFEPRSPQNGTPPSLFFPGLLSSSFHQGITGNW